MNKLKISSLCLMFLIFTSVSYASSLQMQYKTIIEKCDKTNALQSFFQLQEAVEKEFNNLEEENKSEVFYRKSFTSQLHSIFSVGSYQSEVKRLRPLKMCWMNLIDWKNSESSLKKDNILAWQSCMGQVYRSDLQVVKELTSCFSKL